MAGSPGDKLVASGLDARERPLQRKLRVGQGHARNLELSHLLYRTTIEIPSSEKTEISPKRQARRGNFQKFTPIRPLEIGHCFRHLDFLISKAAKTVRTRLIDAQRRRSG